METMMMEPVAADETVEIERIPMSKAEFLVWQVGKVEKQMIEYFAAGVQTLWHVHPDLQMVRVFTSPRQMAGFFDDDRLDAAPALPDMTLTVNELFAR